MDEPRPKRLRGHHLEMAKREGKPLPKGSKTSGLVTKLLAFGLMGT